jgi:hypothetical protein
MQCTLSPSLALSPRILSALVALALSSSLAAAQRTAIPTPESVFGHRVGADSQLIGYDQSVNYFKRLAGASNRIRLIEVGKTSTGHPWTAAIISSPENLARLTDYRRTNMRIAHPEGLSDSAARNLARQGKVFVDISGGLHASEIAGSQHTPQLAYELLSRAADPAYKEIFDNVILFLWPSINPDGQDIVVNWCRANYEGKNPPPMELYQKYIGHDNNRDSYMLNVVESRVIQRTWREWEPDIIYVHHQSSPEPTRIWIPPFADPVGFRAPPIPAREISTIGTFIAQELDAHGKPGAVHQLATYDAWYPGYIDYMPVYQNIPSWWTETQGGSCATPKPVGKPENFPPEYRSLRPEALYLSPWPGGKWGLRDAVDYMVIASTATLRFAAKFKEDILYNRYQSGRDVIQKYRTSAPYAYIVPQAQYDPNAPAELLRRLAFMGIHVRQLDRDMAYEGTTYPKGTWVIPMDQEFAELARELLEVQVYPDMGDDTPYDAAGWTLPYQMNVNVVEGKAPLSAEFRAAMKPVSGKAVDWRTNPDDPLTTNAEVAGVVPLAGQITGSGEVLSLDPAQNNSFRLINRALAEGASLRFQPGSNGKSGRYLVSGSDAAKVDGWVNDLAVRAERTSSAQTSGSVSVPTRIALYKASPGNMDEGWTEWLFDTFGYKYTLITPADVRAGNLGARFDVIVVGSQSLAGGFGRGGRGGGGGGGGGGRGRGAAPDSTAPPDSVVQSFDEFVRTGGTVVTWNQGASAAIAALRLPVRNVVAGIARRQYFTGGSIMRVTTDPTHPVMSGMPEHADVFVSGSPVFTTLDGFEGSVLAKYPSDASPLRSGFLSGEKLMQGYAAALDVKREKGHVVLMAFQPQWRGQPIGTFRVVFNSAFFGKEVADGAKGAPGFWSPPAATTPGDRR